MIGAVNSTQQMYAYLMFYFSKKKRRPEVVKVLYSCLVWFYASSKAAGLE